MATAIFVSGTNIAFRKPANQSTTVRGGTAANGNDGERTTVHDGKRCTETMKEASPWWMVDLLRPYPVGVVRVTTRGCCGHQPLKDIEIRVGNSSTDLQRNPLCAWFPGTIEEGVTKTFTCARTLVEFSNDRCVPTGAADDIELSAFDRTCYEFSVGRGGSFEEARNHCKKHGGDLVHGLKGPISNFLLAELERRKPTLKTQLVWIGAQREPGFTSRTWRWVDGKPAWGKDQPNNYNGEQNCVVLDGGRNWLWNDVGCNLDYLHWICQHSTNFDVGKTIAYHCPDGHMLVGDANRTCTKNGFWSDVNCGTLPGLEHGYVILEDKRTTHGARAQYTCHENYTLIGRERRTCGDDGKWSDEQPQCLFDWCPEPPTVHGGTVQTSGRRAGQTATYTCQNGFILFGSPVLSCGLGGEWSGKAPTCKFVDCGAPPNTDNGRYSLLNGTTTYGSIVEYSCREDYWLDGTERQTCTREGKWSADTPACVLITCLEPELPNGSYVVGYDFNVHSTIEYHCEVGHILRDVDCGKVTTMPNGYVTYTNGTTYLGSHIAYSCVKNYRLSGVSSRVCLESGQWSDESPRCEEHSILSVTGNDRVYGRTLIRTADSGNSLQTFKIGSLVKYRCERGYKVVGEPLNVDCKEPEGLAHGKYILASNVTYYGSAVLYECNANYELDGHGRRLCLENGTWSSDTPQCKEILCGQPETESSMTVQVMTRSIGGIAHYSCSRGQYMEGNSTRICLKKGTWSGKMPTCKWKIFNKFSLGLDVDCKHPGTIENGRVIVMNQTTTYNSAVEYHCVPHYELTTGDVGEQQNLGMSIGIGAGVILFLLIIVGLIYLRLKEDQNAAVMSYATLNDSNGYGMPNHPNIYENIHEDNMYDAPYEEASHRHHHYEPTPISRGTTRPVVTINGVAVR
ncbi:hypothetical protein C0J52_12430 [Blattella germanica]|nr:hypothetical protein C0J52_12430 [Blattella germanica]